MSKNNISIETDKNHLSNKENNFSVIMDYSNENSLSLKNTKNLFFNTKTIEKIEDNDVKSNNENKFTIFFK